MTTFRALFKTNTYYFIADCVSVVSCAHTLPNNATLLLFGFEIVKYKYTNGASAFVYNAMKACKFVHQCSLCLFNWILSVVEIAYF